MNRSHWSRLAVAAAAACALLVAAAPAGAAPQTITALGVGATSNTLVRFAIGAPGMVVNVPVTGLTAGDVLVAIDYRPADRELYGLGVNGNTVRLYRIAPTTGLATLIGSATVTSIVGATSFGMDFQPVADRIRVVDNLASDGAGGNANSFRINPNNGALSGLDSDLDFSGLPGGALNAPLIAVAYDRSEVGATVATAFGIASGGDRLVRLGGVDGTPSPNLGVVENVGLLGADTSNNAGLDIDAETGASYAVLEVSGTSGFYSVNLATGAATLVGTIGTGTADFGGLAIQPSSVLAFDPIAPVEEGGAALIRITRTGPLAVPVSVDYATELTGSTASNADVVDVAGTLYFPIGATSATFAVPTVEDSAVEPDETIRVRLSNPSGATLPGDGTATATITNDDTAPPPPPPPPPRRPPVGLLSVPAQPLDRSLAATFSCNEACSARLVLRLGTRTVGSTTATLAAAGRKRVSFALSRANLNRIRLRAVGPKTAKLTLSATFSDADGKTTGQLPFLIG